MTDLTEQYNNLIKELTAKRLFYNKKMDDYTKSLTNNPFTGKIAKGNYITNGGVSKQLSTSTDKYNINVINPINKEQEDLLNSLPKGTKLLPTDSYGYENKDIIVSLDTTPISKPIGCLLNTDIPSNFIKIGDNITQSQCSLSASLNNSTSYAFSNNTCFISPENYITPSSLVPVIIPGSPIILWTSNTQYTGVSASLTNQGQLVVWDVNSKQIFATPSPNTSIDYVGCFRDTSNRSMNMLNNGSRTFTVEDCKKQALQNNSAYYATQWYNGNNNSQCSLSNDLSSIKQYGTMSNCTKDSNGNMVGSAWSNAVYTTQPDGQNYFLIIEDSGNMAIYLGNSPEDKGMQSPVWESNTSGKALVSLASMATMKNWISSSDLQKLVIGQFVGSPSGNAYLQMDKSGSLVLYASSALSGCKGDNLTSSLYSIDGQQNPWQTIGLSGNVDADGKLFKSSEYSNDFYDINGFTYQGQPINVGSETDCRNNCINNKNCSDYSFSSSGCNINGMGQLIYDGKSSIHKRKQKTTNPVEVKSSIYSKYPVGQSPFMVIPNMDSPLYNEIQQLETRIFDLAQTIKRQAIPNNYQNEWNTHYNMFQEIAKSLQSEDNHIDDIYPVNNDSSTSENNYIVTGTCAFLAVVVGVGIIMRL